MLIDLKIPKVNERMHDAIIEKIHAEASTELTIGAKILDFSVDLSRAYAQNCPPISYYRIVLRERLWIRKFAVSAGNHCGTDASVVIFSTDPNESLGSQIKRSARVMCAGIVYHEEMWSGSKGWSVHL